MKKRVLPIFILILFVGLCFINPSNARATEDNVGTFIKQKMEKLGFQIGSIRNTGKTNYVVFIKGFSAKLPSFTHKGKFKSFSMNVSVILKPGNKDKAGMIGDMGNKDKAGMIGDMGNKDKAGLIGDFGTKVKGTVVLKRSSLLKQNFILDDKAFPKDLDVKIQ